MRWRVRAHVEHILVPGLVAGQIVVLDNMSSHKGARVRQLVVARGVHCSSCQPSRLITLPSKNPFLSSKPSATGGGQDP